MLVGFLACEWGKSWWKQRDLSKRMIASVRAIYPKATIVQMTDEGTEKVEGVDCVQRLPAIGDRPMDYRLRHLAAFPGGQAVTFDTDIIVRRDFRHVFDKPFDVALTKRDFVMYEGVNIAEQMPYNTGVMFFRTRDFWWDAWKAARNLSPDMRTWWGDQLAVAEVAGSGRYRVLELECNDYNCTSTKFPEFSKDPYILHYKGARKRAMLSLPL